ncbi:MAG: flagellar biosynthesis protein FlhF [Tissierellales bacterium]|nr:flagellar biosynthesis protein FlhF [Tissierellales bacterium]
MIIKKYTVIDMKEAFVRAKYELGPDAVLVDQRDVRVGAKFNPFKRKLIEVTFALEEEKELEKPNIKKTLENTINANKPKSETVFKIDDKIAKEKLKHFCELHDKTPENLTITEKKQFLEILFKDTNLNEEKVLSKINILVGPTGVGKTTTIAKIAARETILNKNKVGLITIDTYRIGAVEQLRTYARILNVPFEVVNDSTEINDKLNTLMNCDIILIDTLGMSPNDDKKLSEVNKFIENCKLDYKTYLVISLTTDRMTIDHILNKYRYLNYDSIIVTKVDETNDLSNLWYIINKSSKPIQYICNGQDVPNDIREANIDSIFELSEGELIL